MYWLKKLEIKLIIVYFCYELLYFEVYFLYIFCLMDIVSI